MLEQIIHLDNRLKGNSALRNFARVYTIDGIEGFDARSVLDSAREYNESFTGKTGNKGEINT